MFTSSPIGLEFGLFIIVHIYLFDEDEENNWFVLITDLSTHTLFIPVLYLFRVYKIERVFTS
jgi:hypothetical protein